MRTKILFIVEGPHDEAFLGRLLRVQHGLSACKQPSEVDPFWTVTIPTTFPAKNDLRMRVPVPYFYQDSNTSLAMIVAVGDSQLLHVVQDTIAVLPGAVDALGVFLDADRQQPPDVRFHSITEELSDLNFGGGPGMVGTDSCRCGVYIFPDNAAAGTLENLLEECAGVSYSSALAAARVFVDCIVDEMFEAGELKDFKKPSGRKKATIATLAAILRPGKAIQVSISDNRWLTPETLTLPNVSSVAVFVKSLLEAGR